MSDIASTIKTTELNEEQAAKLQTLVEEIPNILASTNNPEYDEIFGYRINKTNLEYVDENIRNEILLKFLIADKYDIELTKSRLIKTFNWRNEFQPLKAGFEEIFPDELNLLGSITKFPNSNTNNNNLLLLGITTWNLYGNIKNPKILFEKFGQEEDNQNKLPGNLFLRWRIGLMEQSLQLIDFTDPKLNQIAQIQDTNNVSIFNIDPGMKKGMKDIIQILGDNYPELLSIKFFINVPYIMGWIFTFLKKIGIINEDTLKKFQVLNHGDLTDFYPADFLPKSYGGNKDQTIFDINISKEIKLKEYGQIMLKKSIDKEITTSNQEVE